MKVSTVAREIHTITTGKCKMGSCKLRAFCLATPIGRIQLNVARNVATGRLLPVSIQRFIYNSRTVTKQAARRYHTVVVLGPAST